MGSEMCIRDSVDSGINGANDSIRDRCIRPSLHELLRVALSCDTLVEPTDRRHELSDADRNDECSGQMARHCDLPGKMIVVAMVLPGPAAVHCVRSAVRDTDSGPESVNLETRAARA